MLVRVQVPPSAPIKNRGTASIFLPAILVDQWRASPYNLRTYFDTPYSVVAVIGAS